MPRTRCSATGSRTNFGKSGYCCSFDYPQHAVLPSSEHPQVGSLPVTQLIIIAAAQPVPALTSIADAGQFIAQAPHSMQKSLSQIRALLSLISKTPCGHTSPQRPQPSHFSASKVRVVTFSKYLCLILISPCRIDGRRASMPHLPLPRRRYTEAPFPFPY